MLPEFEKKVADIIWENAPISSGSLVKICENDFSWKKSTTYTVLRRLCNKGLFANENGIVRVIVCKEEYETEECEAVVTDLFHGSLPLFITAFTRKQRLSEQEINDIIRRLDEL